MFVNGVPTWGHSLMFRLGWVYLVKSFLLDRLYLLVPAQCRHESDSVTQSSVSLRPQATRLGDGICAI